jgi:hypothetical protein
MPSTGRGRILSGTTYKLMSVSVPLVAYRKSTLVLLSCNTRTEGYRRNGHSTVRMRGTDSLSPVLVGNRRLIVVVDIVGLPALHLSLEPLLAAVVLPFFALFQLQLRLSLLSLLAFRDVMRPTVAGAQRGIVAIREFLQG